LFTEHVRAASARDIERFVAKIHRDLGDPEPPLSLESVRELLRLDRGYYSSTDDSLLRETAHRMKLAGKQVLSRPTRLIEAVKQWDLKALYVPDHQQILIDLSLPAIKQRWAEAHEVGHSLIEWHEALMHGDQLMTLSTSCHQELEAEANFAAGQLLFLGDAFTERLRSSPVTLKAIRDLAKLFGNSITTTLWRAVEAQEAPAVGLVSCHPRKPSEPPVRHIVLSAAFVERFGPGAAAALFPQLASFCRNGAGPIGTGEATLSDLNGDRHRFTFECFDNTHDTLTLALYGKPAPTGILMP
jgi:hypothetical protein